MRFRFVRDPLKLGCPLEDDSWVLCAETPEARGLHLEVYEQGRDTFTVVSGHETMILIFFYVFT